MLESEYQSKVIKKYEALGYYAIKLFKTNKNGIPDLLLLKKDEVILLRLKERRPFMLHFRNSGLKNYEN